MKRLSDYKDEDAIILWGDLFEPIMKILADPAVVEAMKGGEVTKIVKTVLKEKAEEAKECLLIIDNTPINGINMITRLTGLITDLIQSEEFGSFFKSAEQEKTVRVSSGSATENTVEEDK